MKQGTTSPDDWLARTKARIATGVDQDGAKLNRSQLQLYISMLRNRTDLPIDEIKALFIAGDNGLDDAVVDAMFISHGKAESHFPLLERGNHKMTVKKFIKYRAPTLVHHGDFIEYDCGAYVEVHDTTMRSRTRKFLCDCCYKVKDEDPKPVHPGIGDVSQAVDALKELHHIPPNTTLPLWRDDLEYDGPTPPPTECIAFPNCILHVPTGKTVDPTPALLIRNALEFDYDVDAPAPALWLATLADYWPDDPVSQALLQEWFGYCLTQDTSMQKAMMILGPKRSGKGVISRALAKLVGKVNTVGTSLHSIGGEFGLAPMVGKQLAIVGETKFGASADRAEITRRLLSIIGEDRIDVNRKGRDFWTGAMLAVRFLFLGNEIPKFDDAGGAMVARLLVLKMTASFLDREDPTLEDRIAAELPGILLWALEGLRRLRARGRFVEPASSADVKNDVRIAASPVQEFIADCCTLDRNATCTSDALYDTYRDRWCRRAGIDRPIPREQFFRGLNAALQGDIRRERPTIGGRRVWIYHGIKLAPPEPEPDELRGIL